MKDKTIAEELKKAATKYRDDFGDDAFIAGAQWQKEQFEKNRLAACDKQTKEEYERETDFATSIIEKENRQPTFSDAINYGMRLQKEQKPVNNTKWTELCWKDIVELEGIINNVHYDFSAGIGQESFGKEVLERFRNEKDDAEVDACEQKPVEWSEEDYHWEGLIRLLQNYQRMIDRKSNNMAYEDVECYISWLKSLRGKFKED